ncbi:MAG TPA: hypothetical protein VGA73_04215 [Candidatus Binatia bacterium]
MSATRDQERPAARETAARALESGDIYFAYRPKVGKRSARSLSDVQRFYTILSPRGKRVYRLVIVGAKRLPSLGRDGDRKTWGFVEKVAERPEDVEDELDPKTYRTKTRGERRLEAARPAGEGVYAVVRHRDHTHLAYILELPPRPGPVQRALRIAEQASYIVSVKNPDAPAPPGLGLDGARRPKYPKKLAGLFGGRRFIDLDPPDFLDYEGTEILLIGASRDVAAELGVRLEAERETLATAEIFNDLKMERSLHPLAPLFEGRWA